MFRYYLKLSWLSIKRTPLLTALMVLAIGLGIGVSMTVITVNFLMDRDPIPEKSQQLFSVQLNSYGNDNSNPWTSDGFPLQITYQDAINIHRSAIPSRQTASVRTGFSLIPNQSGLTPFMTSARAIYSDFFSMFNISFLYGSHWDKNIDSHPRDMVVLSKNINDKLFNGKNSVGKTVNLESHIYTIVGVIDSWEPTPKFYDLNNGNFNSPEDIFIPFSLLPVHELLSWGNTNGWKTEKIDSYQARLDSELAWIQYWVELQTPQQKQNYKNWLSGYISEQKKLGRFENKKAGAAIRDVKQWLDYNEVVSKDNRVLVGLSFMFLAVCMINTLGLLLAKFLRRAPEVGVRRALGASRRTIFIQHLVDVGLIGFAGGLLGLAIGQLGLLGVKSLYQGYHNLVQMDFSLILLAIFIALISSLIAGLYPAWLICRTNPSVYLKSQ